MRFKILSILMITTFLGSSLIAQDLFFSEYIEGNNNNRAFEIYNGTGAAVDLSMYTVRQSHNGVGFDNDPVPAAYVLPLTGTLADGDVYVIYNNEADAAIISEGDLGFSYADTGGARMPYFTGDDALGLFINDTTLIDVIGVPDMGDPGSGWDVAGVTDGTANHTLVRKAFVKTGNTDWSSSAGTTVSNSEWEVYEADDFTFIGSHTSGGYRHLTVHDLRYVEDPDNDPQPYLGDTVVVKVMVMTEPRKLWIGARWSAFLIDPDNFPNPWSGFFVVQNDTFDTGTNFQFALPGDVYNMTGVVATFSGFGQINLLTGDDLVPIEFVEAKDIPDPLILTLDQLESPAVGEQYEGMYVRVENATVVNNAISGDWASMTDESTATGYLAEYSLWFHDELDNGTYTWPVGGTRINVNGFIRDESGSPGRVYNVNPMTTDDIDILTNPPVISNVGRDIGSPTSSDAVLVSATVVDETSLASTTLHYSLNEGAFMQVAMTNVEADSFTATIPAAADGDLVRYFVSAIDGDTDNSKFPSDTSRAGGRVLFYTARDAGLSIYDLQYTHGYAGDNSGYQGHVVTVSGVVMTDSTDRLGDYYIQSDAAAWSGIWVNDGTFRHNKGDEITVTGEVQENFGITRLDDITSSIVKTAGVGEFAPVSVTTGGFAADFEPYEDVLVIVNDLTVTVEYPDGYPGFGEFTVDDGSGNLRVDDSFSAFPGQSPDTTYALNSTIESITGFGYFSFGNAKLHPRDTLDVVIEPNSISQIDNIPSRFSLEQNYPNPFNPNTTIRFHLQEATNVSLKVYDIAGREVATLVDGRQNVGLYSIDFNASNLASGIYFYRLQAGKNITQKKMVLLK